MSKINDGGAAFPGGLYEHQNAGSNDREPYNHGMTIRDYFAGQAIVAAMELCRDENRDGASFEAHFARRAYEVADAMLAVRNEQPTE